MPFRDFVNGSRLDDTDVNRYWLQQAHIIKSVDEQVVNSATLQNDDELVLPLLANTDYWLECFIKYGAHQDMDLKINFSVPSGTTFDLVHNGLRTGHISTDPAPVGSGIDTVSRAQFTQASSGGTPGGVGTSNAATVVCPVEGRIIVGGTAGNIQMTWSQATALAGSGTIVRAGSCMILQRLTE